MNWKSILSYSIAFIFCACTRSFDKDLHEDAALATIKEYRLSGKKEQPDNFIPISTIDIGDAGAAEIASFDPQTNKLFVVNNSNVNKIDVLDFSNPATPSVIGSISIAPYGGAVNSVAVSAGKLAAAIESINKQEEGKVVIFNTNDYAEVKVIPVGALPDMITYSPDGNYIITANEGEPNSTYTIDPPGTVSIITVKKDYAVTTLDFVAFAPMQAQLQSRGLRVFGPNATFAQDMEPEYVTISRDSRTAWVTLQENNAIAKIDLDTKAITAIFPLGFKDYNTTANSIDASERDNRIQFQSWPVKGMYQPDAIAVLQHGGIPYLFTANEGDAREYDTFNEMKRVGALTLDAAAFPNAALLQQASQLGRLNVTTTLGMATGSTTHNGLYSLGARSLSVWNGLNGSLIFDSGNELEKKARDFGFYDDARSDDKGVEPEGITLGSVDKTQLAFIGLERADAVAIYDVTNPAQPLFLQMLSTGDAPEGVLFINAKDSPVKRSLLVVSAENDGVIKVFMPAAL